MTNGWPERPGVPMNPERDGWHWVRGNTTQTLSPRRWHFRLESWEFFDNGLRPPSQIANWWSYVGPCLTPAEVAALVEEARREEREAIVDDIEYDHRRTAQDGGNPAVMLDGIIQTIRARSAA